MTDRIELYSTRDGNDVTMPTNDMKKEAWKAAESLGVSQKGKEGDAPENGVATMNYAPRLGAFVMTIEGASQETVSAFKEATAFHRTDAAKAAMASELEAIRRDRENVKPQAQEVAKGAASKTPELPRVSIPLFPVPIDASRLKEDQEPAKAASAAMLSASDAAISDLGLKGMAKNSYDMKTGNWVVGGRGLSDEAVKGLEERLSAYRTPEAEAAWRANAPAKPRSIAKGPNEGPDLAMASAARAAGAER